MIRGRDYDILIEKWIFNDLEDHNLNLKKSLSLPYRLFLNEKDISIYRNIVLTTLDRINDE